MPSVLERFCPAQTSSASSQVYIERSFLHFPNRSSKRKENSYSQHLVEKNQSEKGSSIIFVLGSSHYGVWRTLLGKTFTMKYQHCRSATYSLSKRGYWAGPCECSFSSKICKHWNYRLSDYATCQCTMIWGMTL